MAPRPPTIHLPQSDVTLYDATGRQILREPPAEPQELSRIIKAHRPARELPIHYAAEISAVEQVKRALLKLERHGDFREVATLVDAMGRDDRISGCLRTLVSGIMGLPFTMEPADGDGATQKQLRIAAAAAVDFEGAINIEARKDVLRWGLMLGVGLAQLAPWDRRGKRWKPVAKVWHPMWIRWDWNYRCYFVQTEDGEVPVDPHSGQWWLYTPYGYERGWMQGLVRCLAIPFLCRVWGTRDYARYSEVHGLPTRVGYVPQSVTPEEKSQFAHDLADLASETVLLMPTIPGAGEAERYDVKMLEAVARSEQLFDSFLGRQDTNIAVAVLGQNLTTEVSGGSFAATEVHKHIRGDIIRDVAASMNRSLREFGTAPWTDVNFGDRELAPRPFYDATPPEDRAKEATTLVQVGTAIKSMTDAGVPIDAVGLARRFNVPLREVPEEEQNNRPVGQVYEYHLKGKLLTRNEIRRRLGEPPVPGPFGEEFIDLDAAEAAEAATEPLEPGAVPPVKKGRRVPTTLSALSPDASEMEGFVDALSSAAAREGARVMGPVVAQVLDALAQADSPEGLRTALLSLYPKLDASDLEDVIYQACALAELAGRFDVVGDFEEKEPSP